MAKKTAANSVMWRQLDFFPVWVGFTTNEEQAHKCAKKFSHTVKFPSVGCDCVYRFDPAEGNSNNSCVLVLFNPSGDKIQVASLMAHVAVHVLHDINDIINEQGDSTELDSHIVGFVTQLLLEWLWVDQVK